MPNRLIREGINSSERVDSLNADEEVFYRRLLNAVDDYGRFDACPAMLIATCYPLRAGRMKPEIVEQMLLKCSAGERPLLRMYTVGGKSFLEVQDFRQQVRSKTSKYPSPVDGDAQQIVSRCEADAQHMSTKTKAETESKNIDAHVLKHDARVDAFLDSVSDDASAPVANCRITSKQVNSYNSTEAGADGSSELSTVGSGEADPRQSWFLTFWERYWRLRNKSAAKKIFLKKVKTQINYEEVMRELEAQEQEMMLRPEDKRPYASTWLNNEPWKDRHGDGVTPEPPRLMM